MATIYKNFVLLDGTEHMTPVTGLALVIISGRIVKLCKEEDLNLNGIKAVNLGGRYLMPGLVNMHAHISKSGLTRRAGGEEARLDQLVAGSRFLAPVGMAAVRKHARSELFSGVTTVRTLGGIGNFDARVRDRIASGRTEGPRIIAAGETLSFDGGTVCGIPSAAVGTPEAAAAKVNELINGGADVIKLMVTGSACCAAEPGAVKLDMPAEIIKAACDAAHSHGIKVAAHVETTAGLRAALENGADTIEHGAELDPDSVQLMRLRRAAFVCAISSILPFAMFDTEVSGLTESDRECAKRHMDTAVSAAREAVANGVRVGIGTDAGHRFVPHYGMWRELECFRKFVGATPEFTLYTATLRNAEIAGIENETGSIEEGKSADIVVTDGNPLEDFRTLSRPYMVIMKGKEYYTPKVRKSRDTERRLNECLD